MTIYRYGEPSLIDEVRIVKSEGGGVRAYLHAAGGVDPEKLSLLSQSMEPLGWKGAAMQMENHPYLEVRGFDNEKELLAYLRTNQSVQGKPDITTEKELTFFDKLKGNRLYLCGLLNVIADIGYQGYGLLDLFEPKNNQKVKSEGGKTKWENAAAGAAYSAGSISLFLLGRSDQSDAQIKDFSKKFMRYLNRRGIELTAQASVESFAIDHKQGWADNLSDTLHKYPSEIFNVLTGMAGCFILTSALRHDEYPDNQKLNKEYRVRESILGASTATGGFLAALIKEKAPDPNKPKPTGLGAAASWFQEKPNRIASIGYAVSTAVHAWQVVVDFGQAKKNKSTYGMVRQAFRGLFVTLNCISEIVLSMSSKGHGEGVKSDESLDKTIHSIVADAVMRQPEAAREKMIQDITTNFLALPDVLGGNAEEMAKAIREQMAGMKHNPWAARAVKSAPDISKNWKDKVTNPGVPPMLTGPSPA